MNDFPSKVRLLGRREFVDFPDWGLNAVEAKVDTGAYTGAIHADDIQEINNEGSTPELHFVLKKIFYPTLKNDVNLISKQFVRKPIRNSFGEEEVRYLIPVRIRIGHKIIRTLISLTDRSTMKYPVLLGRRMMKGKFWLDISQTHLNGKKIKIC